MQLGKKIILLFFLLPFYTIAQSNPELITNGSFEEIDSCQGFISQPGQDYFIINGCKGWNNPLGQSTSDHFCYTSISPNSPPSILGLGFQYPRTGQCMAGIHQTGVWILPNYREYIQNELLQELEANVYYDFEFYVSLGDLPCAFSNLGIKAYKSAVNLPYDYSLVNEVPDAMLEANDFINDTLNWKRINFTFKAKGGEKFVVIGNFDDSLHLNYQNCDSLSVAWWDSLGFVSGNARYLFIDDVSLKKSEMVIEIPNVFTPNNDLINDVYEVKVKNIDDWSLTIFNRWGNKIEILNSNKTSWFPYNISEGVYFYVFEEPSMKYRQQGSILITK